MRYWLFAVLVILGACSHPQQIVGNGDILSLSGERDCTYQQFSSHTDPASEACPNYIVGEYNETYTAVPRPGWEFTGWDGCNSPTDQCTFNIDASTVQQHWGETAPPLIATFDQYYGFERIAYKVVDAEYVTSSDLLVSLAEDRSVYVYEVGTRTTSRIELGASGSTLSVSPDGTKAAVGHSGFVTYIDLVSRTVENVYPVNVEVYDVVLPGNGYAYVMPTWDRNFQSINLATAEVSSLTNVFQVNSVMPMNVHPSGDYIYATTTNSSSFNGWKYDIRAGAAAFLYKSASSSDYSMCRKLWQSEDGLRIFSACGNVFRASEVEAIDMTFNGALENPGPLQSPYYGPGIASLSHRGDEVLNLAIDQPDRVYIHQYSNLTFLRERLLPEVYIDGQGFQTQGKFIFHTSSGSHIVIASIDEASGLSLNDGIVHVLPDTPPTNVAPWAVVAETLYANLGDTVPLDGIASFDPEGEAITHSWELESAPAGSSAYVISPGDALTDFEPDVKGDYLFRLVVNDGTLDSTPAYLRVEVEDPADSTVMSLGFHVVAAEYSDSLDRIVMVATAPNRLIQYDMNSGLFSETLLPAVGQTVSVAPNGYTAAVGHSDSQQLSIVDLQNELLLGTYPITTDIGDVILAGNGHAYIFPASYSWTKIQGLNLFTGVITESSGLSIYSGTLADLHPSGDFIYGADSGLSPSDLESYDISTGNAAYVDDSPYHGVYSVCGDIWVAETGSQVFTRCGYMFNANPGASDDMTYSGRLAIDARIRSLSHHTNEVALLFSGPARPGDPDISDQLGLFEFDTRRHIRDITLPSFPVGNAEYAARGHHVFHSASGDALAVIMQADENSGLLYDYALYVRRQ